MRPSGSKDTEANGFGKVLAVFTLLLLCLNPRRVSWMNNSARFKVYCILRDLGRLTNPIMFDEMFKNKVR